MNVCVECVCRVMVWYMLLQPFGTCCCSCYSSPTYTFN